MIAQKNKLLGVIPVILMKSLRVFPIGGTPNHLTLTSEKPLSADSMALLKRRCPDTTFEMAPSDSFPENFDSLLTEYVKEKHRLTNNEWDLVGPIDEL